MKAKKFLMLARKTEHRETSIRGKRVNIRGYLGMKAEVKRTFTENGQRWFVVLNPEGASKYIVCHGNGFALAFGNTQKQAIEKAKDLLERRGHKLADCMQKAEEVVKQIKVTVL